MCPHRPPSSGSNCSFLCVCVFSLLAPSLHCSAITAGCAVKSLLLLLSSENTGPHVSSQQPLTYTQIIHNYSVYIKQTDKRSRDALMPLKRGPGCVQSVHNHLTAPGFFFSSIVLSTNAIQVNYLSPHVHTVKT